MQSTRVNPELNDEEGIWGYRGCPDPEAYIFSLRQTYTQSPIKFAQQRRPETALGGSAVFGGPWWHYDFVMCSEQKVEAVRTRLAQLAAPATASTVVTASSASSVAASTQANEIMTLSMKQQTNGITPFAASTMPLSNSSTLVPSNLFDWRNVPMPLDEISCFLHADSSRASDYSSSQRNSAKSQPYRPRYQPHLSVGDTLFLGQRFCSGGALFFSIEVFAECTS